MLGKAHPDRGGNASGGRATPVQPLWPPKAKAHLVVSALRKPCAPAGGQEIPAITRRADRYRHGPFCLQKATNEAGE